MAKLFHDLSSAEKATRVFVKVNGDFDAAVIPEEASVSLSTILDQRPATFITFVDITAVPSEGPWMSRVKGIFESFTEAERASLTVLVVLGVKGGDTDATSCSDFFQNEPETGFSSVWDSPFILSFQDKWSEVGTGIPYIGAVLANGFAFGDLGDIVTPVSYLIGKQPAGDFRVLEKFHMQSSDTGNAEYATAENPTIVENDIISFRVKDASGLPQFPDHAALEAFITRRLRDHAGLIDPATHPAAHQVEASLSIPGAILDLGTTIALGFSEKTIGADTGANFQRQIDPGPLTAFANLDLEPRAQLLLRSAGGSDPNCYLDRGESASLIPADDFLLANQGKNLSIHLTGDAAVPPNTVLKSTNLANLHGPMPGAPLLVGSFSIGQTGLFIRANPNDNGIHTAPLYVSPDIVIIRDSAQSESQWQTTLSDRNFLDPNTDIYANPGAGRENRLFIRAFNKGTMKARDVKAVLYWALPSTLTLPEDWQPVRNTGPDPDPFFGAPTTLPVQAGASMAVSEQLNWTQNLPPYNPPGTGSNAYCFVCMVGCEGGYLDAQGNPADRFPTLPELAGQVRTWDQYYAFVTRPTVAWKNITVVEYVWRSADHHGQFDPRRDFWPRWMDWLQLRIPIRLPIPPRDEIGQFEITSALPRSMRIELTVPVLLAENFVGGLDRESWTFGKDSASTSLRGAGFARLPRMRMPKKDRQSLFVDVRLPEFSPRGVFPIAFRQIHRGREIGRMTYLLKLPAIRKGKPVPQQEGPFRK